MALTSTLRKRVEYGLETIPENETVNVSLRDLFFVFQTMAELNRFFHQPAHLPNIEAVKLSLGSAQSAGGYGVLQEALYRRMSKMLSPEIEKALDEGVRFEHPLPPDYFSEDWPRDKREP